MLSNQTKRSYSDTLISGGMALHVLALHSQFAQIHPFTWSILRLIQWGEMERWTDRQTIKRIDNFE